MSSQHDMDDLDFEHIRLGRHLKMTGGAEPANDFWHGYERSDETRIKLINAIDSALLDNPTMRFSQLLYIFMQDLEFDIWNVYDESFIHFFQDIDLLP